MGLNTLLTDRIELVVDIRFWCLRCSFRMHLGGFEQGPIRHCAFPSLAPAAARKARNGRVPECWSAGVQECQSARVREWESARVLECWSARVRERHSARVAECQSSRVKAQDAAATACLHYMSPFFVGVQRTPFPRRFLA